MADALQELVDRMDTEALPTDMLLDDMPGQSFAVHGLPAAELRPAPHTGAQCVRCDTVIEPGVIAWRTWNELAQRGIWQCCDEC